MSLRACRWWWSCAAAVVGRGRRDLRGWRALPGRHRKIHIAAVFSSSDSATAPAAACRRHCPPPAGISRYGPVGAALGNSFRIGPDDTNWAGILANIDIMAKLTQYAGACV